jgi:hypothetical protein
MRGFEAIWMAARLRASSLRPPKPQPTPRRAQRQADAAMLDRRALELRRAALIASLWPEARQCVVTPLYQEWPKPVALGRLHSCAVQVGTADARALMARLAKHFFQAAPDAPAPIRRAA